MGTRAIIHVKEGRSTIVSVYRQYDGYPSGLGQDIKKALNNGLASLTNGFGSLDKVPNVFNGVGCMAAYLVGQLKGDSIGNVYIVAPNSKDCGEEYTYTIEQAMVTGTNSMRSSAIKLTVKAVYSKKTLFKGLLEDFKPEALE